MLHAVLEQHAGTTPQQGPPQPLLTRLATATPDQRHAVTAAIPQHVVNMLSAAQHVCVHKVWQQLQVVQGALEKVEVLLEELDGGDGRQQGEGQRYGMALDELCEDLCTVLDTTMEDAEALECLVQQVCARVALGRMYRMWCMYRSIKTIQAFGTSQTDIQPAQAISLLLNKDFSV